MPLSETSNEDLYNPDPTDDESSNPEDEAGSGGQREREARSDAKAEREARSDAEADGNATSDGQSEDQVGSDGEGEDFAGSEENDGSGSDGKPPQEPVVVVKGSKKAMPHKVAQSAKGKGSKKEKTTYPDLLELEDEDGRHFYAYKDPDMIACLGREKFVEILRYSPTGVVPEHKVGPNGNFRLYKNTMMHGRQKLASLYNEKEYEELALEAHIDCKKVDAPKGNGEQDPFFCLKCDKRCKDKPCLSWHRMTRECPKQPPNEFPKMYPSWGKSEKDELNRILKLHGKSLPHNTMMSKSRTNAKGKGPARVKPVKATPARGGHSPRFSNLRAVEKVKHVIHLKI